MAPAKDRYRAAAYCRLSREDGDKPESDSIINQQHAIEDFCARNPAFELVATFADDGCTGTNFDRPAFQRMLAQIEAGELDCVIVKDLSRFGRDYIDMGFYLERFFPSRGVRFIAINDGVDSARGAYDMLLPLKNIFNAQYAKDISNKVKGAFRTKQHRGEFIGAFAAYGYQKDPADKNHLLVDPVAAKVVHEIFTLASGGMGKQKIADKLNADDVPSPSVYKRLMGARYRNTDESVSDRKWTYAAVHKILGSELYIGNMVSNRNARETMHGKEQAVSREDWIIVEGTHEAIISRELWDSVQKQNGSCARENSMFAGFLFCGDCGSRMVKTDWNRKTMYCCGNYRRYGTATCTKHFVSEAQIEEVVRTDMNHVIRQVKELKALAESNRPISFAAQQRQKEWKQLKQAIERVRELKKAVYEDYRDKLLDKDEYLRYRADYDTQEKTLAAQLEAANKSNGESCAVNGAWVDRLLRQGELELIDRAVLAQNVKEIRVYENKRIEITYLFSEKLYSALKD